MAHTSPVYVVREGFRPWAADRAAELIADRQRDIATMEGQLLGLKAGAEAGTLNPANDFEQRLVRSLPYNLERMERARVYYTGLVTLLAEELPRRSAELNAKP